MKLSHLATIGLICALNTGCREEDPNLNSDIMAYKQCREEADEVRQHADDQNVKVNGLEDNRFKDCLARLRQENRVEITSTNPREAIAGK